MKEYTAIIREGNQTWEETHKVPDKLDPEETIRTTIYMFNRGRSSKYEFVRIKRKRRNAVKQCHEWEKASLVTERGGYDRMRCKHCGTTGKRIGLGDLPVVVDRKFDLNYCKNK